MKDIINVNWVKAAGIRAIKTVASYDTLRVVMMCLRHSL